MNTQMTHLAGRVLLALIFVIAGLGKLGNLAGTAGYMQSGGVPAFLLWPTIALEVLGGIALIVGFQTRYTAWALAAFCLVSGALFHSDFANQMQMTMFLKNVAIAGGLLVLSVAATPLSLDSRNR